MININTNGLLIDTDFLMNYKKHNLSGEEALFLLQINYLTSIYTLYTKKPFLTTRSGFHKIHIHTKLCVIL